MVDLLQKRGNCKNVMKNKTDPLANEFATANDGERNIVYIKA